MANEPTQKDSTTTIVLIILGVVGGIFVLCLGGAVVAIVAISMLGTTASSTFTSVSPTVSGPGGGIVYPPGSAGQAAKDFCRDLYLDDVEDAHNRLTVARQNAWPLEQFRTDLRRRPTIKDSGTYNVRPSTRRFEPNTFDGEFMDGIRRQEITIRMVQEGGEWKVDEVQFWD